MRTPFYNERELLMRIAAGDAQAFGEMYMRYYDRLYKVALCYIKEHESAEDAVQQVFCRVWEKRESISAILNFEAFITTAARNEIIGTMRRKAKQYRYLHQCNPEEKIEHATPEAILVSRDKEAILSEAVASLSPQQQKIYRLSHDEGMSHAQIAGEMRISVNTVKWHASAALQSIRCFLKNHIEELSCLLLVISLC